MPAQSQAQIDALDWLQELVDTLDPQRRRDLYDAIRPYGDDLAGFRYEFERRAAGVEHEQMEGLAPWVPLPHQIPPADWTVGWLLMGGRGSGKSAAATRELVEHIHGPPCTDEPAVPGGHRCVIVAPTLEDGVLSVFQGPSGIKRHDPSTELVTAKGGTVVRFTNGVEVPIIGAHNDQQADRVRARGNTCFIMFEEAAAIPALKEAYDNAELGLRLGPNPRWVASTTPKARKVLKDMANDPDVVLSRGSINDNPHLDEAFVSRMRRRFAGTRKEAQELEGILVDEEPGALWSIDMCERSRMRRRHDNVAVCVVGVDPSGSMGDDADETGVIVVDAWLDENQLAHVSATADYTVDNGDPSRWAPAAVDAACTYGLDHDIATFIVGEVNYGGQMVMDVINQRVRERGLQNRITVDKVTATRGKRRRAEPVAILWDPTPPRGHIVGNLPDLENQLCTWIDEPGADSPDRMDALVWAATYALQSVFLGIAQGPTDAGSVF